MQRQQPSIFNDIVGPTMVGPSSSHTCGPSRIGFLCQQLLDGTLKKVLIEFAKDGAYTLMYKGQRSDMGFVNGLLGYRPEDPRLRDSFSLAKDAGLEFSFEIADFPPVVPNIARLTLENTEGESVVVYSDSTGGGTVKLLQIDGFDVGIVGDCYEILVRIQGDEKKCQEIEKEIKTKISNNEGVSLSVQDNQGLINIKQRTAPTAEILQSLLYIPNVMSVRTLEPILVVPSHRNTELPFMSAQEMCLVAEKENKTLWELGIDYEMARSGWTHKEVFD